MSETYSLTEAAIKIIQDRRSIRDYTDEPVAESDLDLIIEAGQQAPSRENAQPWRFIIVRDDTTRTLLGDIAGGGSGRRFTAEYVTKKMQERFTTLEDEEKKKAVFEKKRNGQISLGNSFLEV